MLDLGNICEYMYVLTFFSCFIVNNFEWGGFSKVFSSRLCRGQVSNVQENGMCYFLAHR
jgi:hypothetical protein